VVSENGDGCVGGGRWMKVTLPGSGATSAAASGSFVRTGGRCGSRGRGIRVEYARTLFIVRVTRQEEEGERA
jgi:hypothetical protein